MATTILFNGHKSLKVNICPLKETNPNNRRCKWELFLGSGPLGWWSLQPWGERPEETLRWPETKLTTFYQHSCQRGKDGFIIMLLKKSVALEHEDYYQNNKFVMYTNKMCFCFKIQLILSKYSYEILQNIVCINGLYYQNVIFILQFITDG